MRVDFNNFTSEATESNQAGRAGQTRTAASSAANTAATAASLDLDQTQVPALAAQVLAQPDIRETKVQSLQEAIENGEYSVLPSQVADAMASEFGAASG